MPPGSSEWQLIPSARAGCLWTTLPSLIHPWAPVLGTGNITSFFDTSVQDLVETSSHGPIIQISLLRFLPSSRNLPHSTSFKSKYKRNNAPLFWEAGCSDGWDLASNHVLFLAQINANKLFKFFFASLDVPTTTMLKKQGPKWPVPGKERLLVACCCLSMPALRPYCSYLPATSYDSLVKWWYAVKCSSPGPFCLAPYPSRTIY